MIECNLNIRLGNFMLDTNFSIPDKGITVIFGASGSGKTTLLRTIAGLEKTVSGFLKIGDEVWQDGVDFVPPHQRSVGYVFQEQGLFNHLDVRGNLDYGIKRSSAVDDVFRDSILNLLDIKPLFNRAIEELSGGEKQRVSIARALLIKPNILLMDEPLSSLDLKRKEEILPYLDALHDELDIPLIYVTHSPDEVSRLADYLILIDNGKVIGSGKIEDILTRFDLPISHGVEATSIIEANIVGRDENYELMHLDFSGEIFVVADNGSAIGQTIRLRISARDVSLTKERQSNTSILNIFKAVVDDVVPEGKSQVMIRLKIKDSIILSCITLKSAEMLNIKIGSKVYAQIKSVALLS